MVDIEELIEDLISKNANDFDSIGELALWLEKRGFANQFYDGATRDIIDETLKNMENWVQKLYINEGGIGEEISERIEQLKNTAADEQTYFDVFTDKKVITYNLSNKNEIVRNIPHNFGKIPIVYATTKNVNEWQDVQTMIDRLEKLIKEK